MGKMIESKYRPSKIRYPILLLFVMILTFISVILDIAVLRPVLGYLYITFVPGLLLLIILKLNHISSTAKILFSIGLSISFSLILGLVYNSVALAFGFNNPLSTIPLLVVYGVATTILIIVALFRDRRELFSINYPCYSIKDKLALLPLSILPIVAVVSTRIMNMSDNNILLIAFFILIPVCFLFLVYFNNRVSENVLPMAIFLSSISLLLVFLVRNNHITGVDLNNEFFLFNLTNSSNHWQVWTNHILDSCLVVSLLPAQYQSFMQINPEYLYRIMFIFPFSFTPLAVYLISRNYMSSILSFVAAFFFISQTYFIQSENDARNNFAILFFSILMIVFTSKNMSSFSKTIISILFCVGIFMSHYATSYIFITLVFTGLIATSIIRLAKKNKKTQFLGNSSSPISLGFVTLLFLLSFIWYGEITGAPFTSGVRFILTTIEQLKYFFIIESRTSTLNSAFGQTIVGSSMIPQSIELVSSWLTIAFIILGFFSIIYYLVRKNYHNSKFGKSPTYSGTNFTLDYFIFVVLACAIIAITVIVPYISKGYDLVRVYFMMMVILAPVFVLGGVVFFGLIKKKWASIFTSVILVIYFCSTAGLTYQLLGAPISAYLSSEAKTYDLFYVHEQDASAAKWLKVNATDNVWIYSFGNTQNMLIGQGGFSREVVNHSLANYPQMNLNTNSYIFLTYTTVVKHKVAGRDNIGYIFEKVDRYEELFNMQNKIYSTNGSEIYN